MFQMQVSLQHFRALRTSNALLLDDRRYTVYSAFAETPFPERIYCPIAFNPSPRRPCKMLHSSCVSRLASRVSLSGPMGASTLTVLARRVAFGRRAAPLVSEARFLRTGVAYEEPHGSSKASCSKSVEWSRRMDVDWVCAMSTCRRAGPCHLCSFEET